MKYLFLILTIIMIGLNGCRDESNSSNIEGKIIWTSERFVVTPSFTEVVRRYNESRKVKEKGYSTAIEILLNTSQKAIYSIDCFNSTNIEKIKFSIGYFIVDSTKCFLFSGFEPLVSNNEALRTGSDSSEQNNDDMRFIRLFKDTGKAEFVKDGEQENWELEHIKEQKVRIHNKRG